MITQSIRKIYCPELPSYPLLNVYSDSSYMFLQTPLAHLCTIMAIGLGGMPHQLMLYGLSFIKKRSEKQRIEPINLVQHVTHCNHATPTVNGIGILCMEEHTAKSNIYLFFSHGKSQYYGHMFCTLG